MIPGPEVRGTGGTRVKWIDRLDPSWALEVCVVQEESCEGAACEWAEDGDGCVGPVRSAFAGDGQDGVSNARAKIAGGVDGVAGRSAKGKADAPDETGDEPLADSCGW